MSVGYRLINATKREILMFMHLPVNTRREISGYPVASTMVAWYLLHHVGDEVSFVPDDKSFWPFSSVGEKETESFREVSDEIIQELIDAGLLSDNGIEILDQRDPDVFLRKLSLVWWGSGLPEGDDA